MKDKTQRIEKIDEALASVKKNPNNPNYRVRWRDKVINLPIIQLEVSFLKYRLENSRTKLQQLHYLRNHPELPADLFNDPESQKAQEAQEEILMEMSSNADFLKDLEKIQEDPAIITYDGFIVNGNRRTSALKKIGKTYVDCVVLPSDANKKELYELEQELQIAEDFKEEYHWINELCNIRDGLTNKDFGITKEQMAERLKIEPKEIDRRMNVLALLDSFLNWKKIPGQYDYEKIDQVEQIFKQLEKALRSFNFRDDINKQDVLKSMVFTLIEEKPQEERLYWWVSKLIKNFEHTYREFSTKDNSSIFEQNNDTMNQNYKSKEEYESGLLEELAHVTLTSEYNSKIFDSNLATQNSEKITDVVDKVEELSREQNKSEFVYESVSTALRQLQGIYITGEHTKLEATKKKLNEIIIKATELSKEIDLIPKNG